MTDAKAAQELLACSALFSALELAERRSLVEQMHDIVLQPGQMLFARGDPGRDIYLVILGRLRISVVSPDGRELSFSHAVKGDVLGEIAALDGANRSADATAVTEARLKRLPQKAFRALLLAKPLFAMAALGLLCSRLRDVSDHFEGVALHPIDVRLARLLLDQLEDGGVNLAITRVASLRKDMSQTDLALLIGATRQRANSALLALENAGAIFRAPNQIECDVKALQKIALR
jgi:CRP/FNR family transcriptional regulator, cyclic AMP receptor protein